MFFNQTKNYLKICPLYFHFILVYKFSFFFIQVQILFVFNENCTDLYNVACRHQCVIRFLCLNKAVAF